MHKERYFLFLILAAAFVLRLPQLNFPAIGYHNMKENEYISMAKIMAGSGDYISRDVYFYNAFSNQRDIGLYPQVPFVAYQVLLGYKFFGDNLWFARLLNIILMLLAIAAFFYFAKALCGESVCALSAALLAGTLPLGVYCSRNLQPEAGAFLFLVLGSLFFLKFAAGLRLRHLLGLAACFMMTIAYKMTFLAGFAPLAFIFPYKRYFRSRGFSGAARDILLLVLPTLLLCGYFLAAGQASLAASWKGRVDLFNIFTSSYWRQNGLFIWHYLRSENFTGVYLLLFFFGAAVLWLNYKRDSSPLARYLRGWFPIVVLYGMFFSDYLNQHNYYQMPFLGFFALVVVYFVREFAGNIAKLFRRPPGQGVFAVIFLAIFLAALPGLKASISSYFEVIYAGTDEIGRMLKKMTSKDERFFIYTFAQGYAPCVYAERRCGWCDSLEEMKSAEKKFGIRYLVSYPYDRVNQLPDDTRDYLAHNYHIAMVGVIRVKKILVPEILVLKRGGRMDEDGFYDKKHAVELRKVYRTVAGSIPFYILQNKSAKED